MELYALRDTVENKILKGGFGSKQDAKQQRRKLNETTKEGREILRYVVTLGKDHRLYDGPATN